MPSCEVCQLPIANSANLHGPSSNSRQCPFCLAVFSRVDGARRHGKVCPQRGDRALHAGKRGRKINSCDECWRIKVHCNAQLQSPCGRCISRKLRCTFSRCCTNPTHRRTTNKESHGLRACSHTRIPLSFLLNVTDDRLDFVTEKAVAEEPDGALLGPTCVPPLQAQTLQEEVADFINPALLIPSEMQDCIALLELDGLHNAEEQNLLGSFLSPRAQEDQLKERLDLLESSVAAYAASLDGVGIIFDQNTFQRLFTVSNVYTFAMSFCHKRHYQYPVIHWPTFRLETASLPLLMVVSLTGATYSYRPGHESDQVTDARQLYHLADSYTFHQFKTYLGHCQSEMDVDDEALQLCQAALLMYALDTLLAGNAAMQNTAIAERLPSLVSTMRRLHFFNHQHSITEDWETFIHHETIIRLAAWTFCADCLATLSCNSPSIIPFLEMSGDLPCDSTLWDADSAPAYELSRMSRMGISPSLKELMHKLLVDERQLDECSGDIPLFHLHVMLCGKFMATFLSCPVCKTLMSR